MKENNWQSIRRHPINSSSSKATYAFPKQKRFNSTNKTLCDSFYNIPTTLRHNLGTSLGSGNKISLALKNQSPSPQKYNIKSQFNQKLIGGKISIGRQNYKYGGIFNENKNPEPGHYNIQLSKTNNGFSMKAKLKYLQPSYMKAPGPGQYKNLETLNISGKYLISNLKNCNTPKIIAFKQFDRLKQMKKSPGPGQYNEKQNFNCKGNYFNSKFENSRCRSFSKSSRKSISSSNLAAPGPGSYNPFTEFGSRIR